MWWFYALLSAIFAALTAIFAKAGVKGVDPDLATAYRTTIVLVMAAAIVIWKGNAHTAGLLTKQNLLFLTLSGLATGASWIFYFRALHAGNVSQVAPVDKLSIVFTIVLAVIFLHETVTLK